MGINIWLSLSRSFIIANSMKRKMAQKKDTRDWNAYFYSHYRPLTNEWGRNDLRKYTQWYQPWISYIEAQLHTSFQGKDVLELGCGIGAVSGILHKRGARVIGSDISSVMVEHAKRLQPEISFIEYDVTKPYKSSRVFDAIIAFEVLEHILPLELALEHIYTLLKPGGWFIGSTPYPYPKNMVDPTHVNVHPPEFWRKAFQDKKFSQIQTVPMSFLPALWRLPVVQPILPWYIGYRYMVSTTLLLMKK